VKRDPYVVQQQRHAYPPSELSDVAEEYEFDHRTRGRERPTRATEAGGIVLAVIAAAAAIFFCFEHYHKQEKPRPCRRHGHH
jgi:hypothetical protein